MAQPLSDAATSEQQRVITQLCLQLEFFEGHSPLQIRPLAAGQSNQNFYLATARGEYVLRRYLSQLGVCRQQEFRCQQAAAAQGLAPTPLLLHNHYQVLLSEFIPAGEPLTLTTERIPLLAQALARLHALPVQTPVLAVEQYLRQLLSHTQMEALQPAADVFSTLLKCASAMQHFAGDQVLCHFDLHTENILWAHQRLWLLDFEYAQLADNSFDLAAVILNFGLTETQQLQFMASYQHARQYDDAARALDCRQSLPQRLYLAKCLYCGFCWLWYQAMPQHTALAQQWLLQLQRLLASKPA